MAQEHLKRLSVLLVHGEQEKRQHHQDHAQRRRGGSQARLCQKEKRHAYQRRRSETDHLSFGQPEQDLALYPAQVLRDRYIGNSKHLLLQNIYALYFEYLFPKCYNIIKLKWEGYYGTL